MYYKQTLYYHDKYFEFVTFVDFVEEKCSGTFESYPEIYLLLIYSVPLYFYDWKRF